ncbi:MAG: hypothetical protein ACP5RO_03810 [Fervidicoccaceae archaeon]|jgi:flavin-dependent dehydrogenase
MSIKKVRIFGAGPAGSSFAIEALSLLNIDSLELYDGECPYKKPCGEALLNQDMKIYDIDPPIIKEVKDFYISIEGNVIAERHYSTPIWFIIDKEEWISLMRREVIRLGGKMKCARLRPFTENGFLTIDARGPFTEEKKRRIPIARAILEGEIPYEGVLLDFDPKNVGFYWIFPSKGKKFNAGYGSLLSRKPRDSLLEYLQKIVNKPSVEEISTSIITLEYPSPDNRGGIFKIGEAAGTVFPLTGEGIRPSVYHSKEFAKKLSEGLSIEEAYLRSFRMGRMGEIERQMRSQSRILSLLSKAPNFMRKFALRLLPSFLDSYIKKGEIPFI